MEKIIQQLDEGLPDLHEAKIVQGTNLWCGSIIDAHAYSTPTEAAGGTGAGSGNGWSRQSPSGRDSPLPAAVAGAAAPNPGAVARESCTGSLCVPLVEHVWRCVAVARLTTSICVVLVQIHITTEDRDSWLKNATVAVFFQDAQSFLHNPLFGRDS